MLWKDVRMMNSTQKFKQIWETLAAAKILPQFNASISTVFLVMNINLFFHFQKGVAFQLETIVQLIIL